MLQQLETKAKASSGGYTNKTLHKAICKRIYVLLFKKSIRANYYCVTVFSAVTSLF